MLESSSRKSKAGKKKELTVAMNYNAGKEQEFIIQDNSALIVNKSEQPTPRSAQFKSKPSTTKNSMAQKIEFNMDND